MIVPITSADIPNLSLAADSRFTPDTLARHLARYPHLAFRLAGGPDYALGSCWHRRPEIGLLLEVASQEQRPALVERLLAAYRQAGARLVVLSDSEAERALDFYRQLGFSVLEEVIPYEQPHCRVEPLSPRLALRPLATDDLPALVALEEQAFPWLWWETAESFWEAAQRPDCWVYTAWLGGELVGYLILARRNDLGHINRIAVHPRWQGRGYGAELLTYAIGDLARHGARRVGLNTQSNNTRSQRLYERFAFQCTGERYGVYGLWLEEGNTLSP
ncbi:MAG: GNAT family N-acetyltransferase [Chloroflexi bacterium]|nr:GNAT family N-acetyltransferase [Chloroflexota bacterium]